MSIYKLMPIVGALALAFAIGAGPSRSGCTRNLALEPRPRRAPLPRYSARVSSRLRPPCAAGARAPWHRTWAPAS